MKIRTWITAGMAGAIGYVAGTAAGRERFEQLKSRAQSLTQNPKVQQNLSNIAGTVASKAETMNPKVGGVVKSAAQQVQSKVGGSSTSSTTAPSTVPDLGAPAADTTFATSPLDDTYPASPVSDFDDTIPPTTRPGSGI